MPGAECPSSRPAVLDPLPETRKLKDSRSKLRGRDTNSPRPERTFDPMNHETTTHHQTDEAQIRALFDDLLADWGRGDGQAYGSRFTEDADYVAFDGTHIRGRAEISASHQELFDRFLQGTQLTGRVFSVKYLNSVQRLFPPLAETTFRAKRRLRRNRI